MGAEEVIKIFEKHPKKEFVSSEIAKIIGETACSVQRILRNLLNKDPFIDLRKRELTLEEKRKRYGKPVAAKICVYSLID